MPRSGTWLSFFFFEYFDSFLTDGRPIRTHATTYTYEGLGFTKAHAHLMCPGFPEFYNGPLRPAWDALEFKVAGINSGYDWLAEQQGHFFNVHFNRDVRIAYLYRNPLDQAVSHFHHLHWRQRPMEADQFRAGLLAWLREMAIESYIKQYFTYHVMRQAFPGRIICVGYEDLIRAPRERLGEIASHFGCDVDTSYKRDCFDRALEAVAPSSLREVEAELGHAFGHPEVTQDSHMQGGEIGKWRQWLDDATVAEIDRRFAAFDLSLGDFVLT
jgi:hypothetical protein